MNQLAAYIDARKLTGTATDIAETLDARKRYEADGFERLPTEKEIAAALNQCAAAKWLACLQADVLSRMADDPGVTIDGLKAAIANYRGRA